MRSNSARVGVKEKSSLHLLLQKKFPFKWCKVWELTAVSLCLSFLKLTQNYSELVISYFCLLSRLGKAAFIIIIIRYKNNYPSTKTYSTYNQRTWNLQYLQSKNNKPTNFSEIQILERKPIIILCSALNPMPNSYIFQNFK